MQGIRAVPVKSSTGSRTWTVVGSDGLPVDEAESYLHALRATQKSTSTVRSYAHHLAHLYRWLHARGVGWDGVTYDDLADFMFTLKMGLPPLPKKGGGERTDAAVRAAAAAIREFYEHHRLENRGPTDLRLSRQKAYSSRTTHHFLAHIEQRRPVDVNRLAEGLARSAPEIEVIGFEPDFELMLTACTSFRDRLLLSSLYDLGLRVGQSLGLRHSDLDAKRKRVRVERRTDNENGALSKSRQTLFVTGPDRFFRLYREYLLEELADPELDSDYLFVNTQRPPFGRPCSYSNIYQTVIRIGRRAGLGEVNPHMLRHTHATALAKAGWTSAEIAARLGQEYASSADVYIHLVENDLSERLAATQHLIWPSVPGREA